MKTVHATIAIKNKLAGDQPFKISRFKEVIKRTSPHKHEGYIEIIYLAEGAGFHWIDAEKIQIQPPVVFFLSGQLHCWELTSVPKGYVLLVREDFLHLQQGLGNIVRAFDGAAVITPHPDDRLEAVFEALESEYRNPARHSTDVIQGYLRVLLARLLRNHESAATLAPAAMHVQIFRKFVQLIQQANPITNLKVSELAAKLGVSPQHLNTITQKVAGKPASRLIHEQVILEAKRYLLHSDKNVNEIAFALNFADPSHFVKFFKRHGGVTPQTFRARHFQ